MYLKLDYSWKKYISYIENECLNFCESLAGNNVSITYCLFNSKLDYYYLDVMIEEEWRENQRVMSIGHDFSDHKIDLIFHNEEDMIEIDEVIQKRSK